MSCDDFRNNLKYKQFGTVVIILGVLPIVYSALVLVTKLMKLSGLYAELIKDIALTTVLIYLLVNNSLIKNTESNNNFQIYYGLMMVYTLLSLSGYLFYYITFFIVQDALVRVLILISNDVILIIALIYYNIAWIRLKKFAILVLNPQFSKIIHSGTTLLVISGGIEILRLILDISTVLILNIDDILLIMRIFGLIQGFISIVGYFLVGVNLKKVNRITKISEPIKNGKAPFYLKRTELIQKKEKDINFCKKCGNKLLPDTEYCQNCGCHVQKYS
jgi:hypothetical protein